MTDIYLTISLSTHIGDDTTQRYSSTLSLTSALNGLVGQRHPPTALPTGKGAATRCTGIWVGRAGPGRAGRVPKI